METVFKSKTVQARDYFSDQQKSVEEAKLGVQRLQCEEGGGRTGELLAMAKAWCKTGSEGGLQGVVGRHLCHCPTI